VRWVVDHRHNVAYRRLIFLAGSYTIGKLKVDRQPAGVVESRASVRILMRLQRRNLSVAAAARFT
jgi:hypothetical protein